MTQFFLRFLINAAAVTAAAYLIPGIERPNLLTIVVVALVFGFVNAVIRPIALAITCLLNVFTLGLFTLVVNAAMFGLTSWVIAQIRDSTTLNISFDIPGGFLSAFFGALVAAIMSFVLTKFLGADSE